MTTNANLFTVGYAAFETAGAIRFANKLACFSVVSDFVVYFRTGQAARLRARANRHSLDRGNRHHCLSQQSVELQIPRGMRTQTRDHSACDYFENAAERVALLPNFIDEVDHSLLRFVVGAVQRCVIGNGCDRVPTQLERRVWNPAELDHVTAYLDAEVRQQLFRERAARDARGGFACGGAFENVAQIACVVLETAGEIC